MSDVSDRAERLSGAVEWIESRLQEAGTRSLGEPELVRDRPWSTQLRVPTPSGPAWFKANAPAFAFEPAVHGLLADLLPDDVDTPLGVDADRGWLLTRDRGPTLSAVREASATDWQQILALMARIQMALTRLESQVLATGLPDRRPVHLLARFDAAVEAVAALPDGHPAPARSGRDGRAAAGPAPGWRKRPASWRRAPFRSLSSTGPASVQRLCRPQRGCGCSTSATRSGRWRQKCCSSRMR